MHDTTRENERLSCTLTQRQISQPKAQTAHDEALARAALNCKKYNAVPKQVGDSANYAKTELGCRLCSLTVQYESYT